jgi:hypothetical protein
MVHQNTYRGVPIPDSTVAGNIFPIPGCDIKMEPYFLNCCLTPVVAAVDLTSKCDAEKRLVCM